MQQCVISILIKKYIILSSKLQNFIFFSHCQHNQKVKKSHKSTDSGTVIYVIFYSLKRQSIAHVFMKQPSRKLICIIAKNFLRGKIGEFQIKMHLSFINISIHE